MAPPAMVEPTRATATAALRAGFIPIFSLWDGVPGFRD
jgi:hypothetical protein